MSARIAMFAGLFPPAFRGGGPIRSVDALVRSAPTDVAVDVLTADRDLGSREPLPVESNTWVQRDGASVYYATISSPRNLFRALRSLRARHPQLLHFNSFFTPHLTIAPLLLWRLGFWGKPQLLLAPRGEFGDGALGRRAWKKKIYIAAFRLLRIHRSIIWHSTAEHETQAIHAMWGARARIIFRENDTLLPETATPPATPDTSPLRAVNLGRIVKHKGVLIAIKALQTCKQPVTLDIYGAREDPAYMQQCEDAVRDLPAAVTVTFHDEVQPDDVRGILAQHDVLLMPTAGENFGHVIAEALSVSCVVMTTPYTPWTDVLKSGAGIVVPDRTSKSWCESIETLAQKSPDEIHELRIAAAQGYGEWAARPRPPHVWDMVRE